jgi:UDP-N-acetylglucosamine--N-acetylmuramyl-(pentapeptide) pyrophosphoryl-undecaprenol N-acetylglucosamine transferase
MLREDRLTILISTGGTGGHLFPALSIAREAKRRNHRVYMVMGGEKIRTEIGEFKIFRISAAPITGNLKSKIGSIIALFKGFIRSLRLLSSLKGYGRFIVISTGSYASIPVLTASLMLRVPYYLMEQNVLPGKTIKLFSRWSKGIFVSFEETIPHLEGAKVFVTGNPLREEVFTDISEREAKIKLGFDDKKPLIFVLGGSLGALKLIEMGIKISKEMPHIQFLIQTGRHHLKFIGERVDNVKFVPFIEDMGIAYRASDIVIARAGGGTIAELFLHGKPAILVPFPHAKMNHQLKNAEVPQKIGGAIVMEEKELSTELKKVVENLINSDKLEDMGRAMSRKAKPEARRRILDIIEKGE